MFLWRWLDSSLPHSQTPEALVLSIFIGHFGMGRDTTTTSRRRCRTRSTIFVQETSWQSEGSCNPDRGNTGEDPVDKGPRAMFFSNETENSEDAVDGASARTTDAVVCASPFVRPSAC